MGGGRRDESDLDSGCENFLGFEDEGLVGVRVCWGAFGGGREEKNLDVGCEGKLDWVA